MNFSDGDLQYFARDEFLRGGENWFERMNPRLLFSLDLLRHRWTQYLGHDAPITISPHDNALGRYLGESAISDHNFEYWGRVNAADVMVASVTTQEQADAFGMLADDCGITARGFYPDWEPHPGFHLAMRADKHYGSPAVWGAVSLGGVQAYTTWQQALEAFA